jgi:hypothetical protein
MLDSSERVDGMGFWKKQPKRAESWTFEMSPPGVLHVRGLTSSLCYEDVRGMTERLLGAGIDQMLAEIVFDFRGVREFRAPWTPVVAKLIDFARRSRAVCRLIALEGQPAAIVSLFKKSIRRSSLELEDQANPPRA